MCCTGPCGVENINTEPDKLTTDAEGSLLPNKIYTAVVLRAKQNNYTSIAPNSHINIVWNLSSKRGKPIRGSNLTIRSVFAVYTSSGPEEISVQLADIKLQ